MKCYCSDPAENHGRIKLCVDNQPDIFFNTQSSNPKEKFSSQYHWFSKIICSKLMTMNFELEKPSKKEKININVPNISFVRKLYKKSQHFGQWNIRYIGINSEGLFSFKDNAM
jgi:hypothetical protein